MSDAYDIVVVGGGPVGLATAYESSKAGKRVLLLEQSNLFNQSGSSGDLVRMFRTMYTEDYLADLALHAHEAWKSVEQDSSERLVWMTGLLNFGDANASGAEGTLLGPIPNLDRHKMSYRRLTGSDIAAEYPFTNLPANYEGLYADLNGCINVPLTLRTLHRLVLQHGGKVLSNAQVTKITHGQSGGVSIVTYVNTKDGTTHNVTSQKVAITGGAYVNHVLRPSFGFELDLNIWEMVYSYFSVNPGPDGTLFRSMWFQFAENPQPGQPSNMFYGFPALPWGVPNTVRIAVDSAVRMISDPDQRTVSPAHEILQHTSDWVKQHIKGADHIPNFTGNCLQTNVIDNNFVLDFIPNTNNDVVIFTAGWAMKFVPLLGKILTELMIHGKTQYDVSHFKITREGIIKKPPTKHTNPAPGMTHFLGGKYVPSVHAHLGQSHKVLHGAHPLAGSQTPVKTEVLSPKATITQAFARLHTALPGSQRPRTSRAALMHNLLHARFTPPNPAVAHAVPAAEQPQGSAPLEGLIKKAKSAHHVIKKQYRATLLDSPALGSVPKHLHTSGAPPPPDKPSLTVGIVGGGMAGLYAALILKDLGIDFTLFEANESRWGGRVFTHHFNELHKGGYKGIYDYVDMGAMRFPQIDSMKRTFDLFKLVGLDEKHWEKYILSHENNVLFYNDVRMTRKEYSEAIKKDNDPLHFAERNGGGVPDSFVERGADAILNDAFGPILEKLQANFENGFAELMNTDGYSTRAYLTNLLAKEKVKTADNVNVVNWLETLNSASGLYDQAFSESIMDALDFQSTDAEGKEIPWYCLTGGTETLVAAVVQKLDPKKLHKGREVMKIAPAKDGHGVALTVRHTSLLDKKDAHPKVEEFDHVICTVPLSILRQINLDECKLGYHKRTAMRIMNYDHSTKVAMVFKTRWWQKLANPIFGGQSSTDLFIRTVVYPSQGIHDDAAPGILLISYSWAQDASRMASICLREDLAERCLENLATLHNISLQTLKADYLEMIKFVDWHREPFLDGAFALFGPGQFVASFQGAITPEVHGHLHFAGEALSVHHAWIIGSLNSAYRTVHEILAKQSMADKIELLKKNWGTIDSVEYGGVDLDQFVHQEKPQKK